MQDILSINDSWPFLEVDLVNSFVNMLKKSLFGFEKPTVIQREVSTGKNIADVVTFYFKTEKKDFLYKASLSSAESVLLSHLRINQETSLSELLENRLFGESDSIIKSLKKLSKLNAISIENEVITANTRDLRIVAYEAKLRDWKKAIKQASSYLKYADESYVVLPEKYSKAPLLNLDRFTESGIGLIIVNENNNAEIVLKASLSKTHNWRREFVYSRSLLSAKAV